MIARQIPKYETKVVCAFTSEVVPDISAGVNGPKNLGSLSLLALQPGFVDLSLITELCALDAHNSDAEIDRI